MIDILWFVLAGVLCGFLNTLASSGSAVTLPLLMMMGLSPAVANGTNRVPVLVGALVASLSFLRSGLIDWRLAGKILVPTVLGSLLGAQMADTIQSAQLKWLITIAVLMALLLMFMGVKQALLSAVSRDLRYRWQEGGYLFAVGFWLGLIVLDGATYLLLVLILGLRLQLAQANVYKNLALLVTSALALVTFSQDGHIDWSIGAYLALGSILGAWIGARLAIHPLAKVWTYRLLVALILMELSHMGFQYWQHGL